MAMQIYSSILKEILGSNLITTYEKLARSIEEEI